MALSNVHRYLAIGKESTYATAVPTDAVGEVESETFGQTFDVNKRSDMNYWNSRQAVMGKISSSGGWSQVLQPCRFTMMCIHGLFGDNPTVFESTGPTTGIIAEPAITSVTELPSYTFRIGRDDGEAIFPGQVMESMSVSASVGEYAMISFATIGSTQTAEASGLGTDIPTYTGDALHFAKTYVNFEEAATSSAFSSMVQSIDFEIKNNHDIDNTYALGSNSVARKPPVTTREVSGSITFHKMTETGDTGLDDAVTYAELMGATSANGAAEVYPGSSTPALSVLFEDSATNFIRFDFFNLHYEMPETSVSGRDSQTMTVKFHALYDLTATSTVKVAFESTDSALSTLDLDA
jgi:hypothetical protein